jgi:hypothetical protein
MDRQQRDEVEMRLRTRTQARIQQGMGGMGADVRVAAATRRGADQAAVQDYRVHILLSALMLLLALVIANLR